MAKSLLHHLRVDPSGQCQSRVRELAMSAGRAAIAAGFGQSSRADGKLACGHCTKCDQARPDLCRQPMEPVVAKALAAQARADRIAEAEADAADMACVIWQQQAARGRSSRSCPVVNVTGRGGRLLPGSDPSRSIGGASATSVEPAAAGHDDRPWGGRLQGRSLAWGMRAPRWSRAGGQGRSDVGCSILTARSSAALRVDG
jgi:hypothetical protein